MIWIALARTKTTMFWTSSHTEQEHAGRENKDVYCGVHPSWWNYGRNIRGKIHDCISIVLSLEKEPEKKSWTKKASSQHGTQPIYI